jgi:hypothetical protein
MSEAYLNNCKKWFDSNNMDFSIECVDGKWYCSAWFRNKWGGANGKRTDNLLTAVNSCMEDAKKEIENPTVRKRDWSPS